MPLPKSDQRLSAPHIREQEEFLQRLEHEAQRQVKLNQTHLLPQQLGWVGRVIAHHPWQITFLVSGITALIVWRVT